MIEFMHFNRYDNHAGCYDLYIFVGNSEAKIKIETQMTYIPFNKHWQGYLIGERERWLNMENIHHPCAFHKLKKLENRRNYTVKKINAQGSKSRDMGTCPPRPSCPGLSHGRRLASPLTRDFFAKVCVSTLYSPFFGPAPASPPPPWPGQNDPYPTLSLSISFICVASTSCVCLQVFFTYLLFLKLQFFKFFLIQAIYTYFLQQKSMALAVNSTSVIKGESLNWHP